MEKKWKLWEDQGDLKLAIRDCIGLGMRFTDVCERVSKESEGRWQWLGVMDGISELLKDCLLISSDGFVQVSELAHESLVKATNQADYTGALMFLFEKGIKHPDMERYGLTDGGELASEASKKSEEDAAAKMTTMPDSDKVKRVEKAQGDSATYSEVPAGAEQISSAVQSVASEIFKSETCEFTVEEIIAKIKEIDPAVMAAELGNWIVSNVEQFIDNQEYVFRMYLTIQSGMAMPVCSLYQRLYLSIPDDDADKEARNSLVENIIDELDAKLDEVRVILKNDKDFLKFLFTRMVYFYELTSVLVIDGKVQQSSNQQLEGCVQINELVFDPISLTTTVSQGVGQYADGKVVEGDKKVVIKKSVMPAGFGIEIEISIRPKNQTPLSMY